MFQNRKIAEIETSKGATAKRGARNLGKSLAEVQRAGEREIKSYEIALDNWTRENVGLD